MKSPYEEAIADFVVEVDRAFSLIMEFDDLAYSRDYVEPGTATGFSFAFSYERTEEIYAGMECWKINFQFLATLGAETAKEASRVAAIRVLRFDNAVASIKQLIEGGEWIANFSLQPKISVSPKQSISEPYWWMVDIAADAIAEFYIYKDASGHHILPPNLPDDKFEANQKRVHKILNDLIYDQ